MIKNLVFSGCSSKFYIILGCIKCLIDHKYIEMKSIDNILCSSGSIIIVYFILLGYTLKDIKDIIMKINTNVVFYDNKYNQNIIENIFDLNCIINYKKFREIFEAFTYHKIKSISITFKKLYELSNTCLIINAYCYDTNKIEYFSYKNAPDMNVIDAILMTISLPVLFQPIIYEDKTYCDPGIIKHVDFAYFFKNLQKGTVEYNIMKNETLGILIESDYTDYKTPLNRELCSEEDKITNLIKYLSRIFNVMTDTTEDYSIYNVINFTSPLRFYDLEINNDTKNKLILIGYKKTYDYIK